MRTLFVKIFSVLFMRDAGFILNTKTKVKNAQNTGLQFET